ncbi:hypothetical protein ES702_00201 [subsurface metagenome]
MSSLTQLESATDVQVVTETDAPSVSQTTNIDGSYLQVSTSMLDTGSEPSLPTLPANFTLPSLSVRDLKHTTNDPPLLKVKHEHMYKQQHIDSPEAPSPESTSRIPSAPFFAVLILSLSLIVFVVYRAKKRGAIREREWLRRRLEGQRRAGLGRRE